jgi:murein DD-endopeptidase MepM/ murein hydrolase activator NlpD
VAPACCRQACLQAVSLCSNGSIAEKSNVCFAVQLRRSRQNREQSAGVDPSFSYYILNRIDRPARLERVRGEGVPVFGVWRGEAVYDNPNIISIDIGEGGRNNKTLQIGANQTMEAGDCPTENSEPVSRPGKPFTGMFGKVRTTEQGFAYYHSGTDFYGEIGDPVYPMHDNSKVVDIGFKQGKVGADKIIGNWVKLEYKGITEIYGHLACPADIKVGQVVNSTKIIGYVGSTGNMVNNPMPTHVHVGAYYISHGWKLWTPVILRQW